MITLKIKYNSLKHKNINMKENTKKNKNNES